jgi:hypothetical protein
MARLCSQLSALVILAMPVGASSAVAASAGPPLAVQDDPIASLGTPVGLAAVGFGVTGMVAGVLRRKKATIQPENQRKG